MRNHLPLALFALFFIVVVNSVRCVTADDVVATENEWWDDHLTGDESCEDFCLTCTNTGVYDCSTRDAWATCGCDEEEGSGTLPEEP